MSVYILAKNRKVFYNYAVLETYIAGLVLKGYEAKAIREGKVSFEGSYVDIIDGRPYVVNLYVGRYSKQSKNFSEEDYKRNRILLLNKDEVVKIARAISEKGKTAVPLALALKNGVIKLEIAVVRGKKEFEKKVVAKERQIERELERQSKEAGAR